MSTRTPPVRVGRDDLLLLRDDPSLIAIVDAIRATEAQHGGLRAALARRRRPRRLVLALVAAAAASLLAGAAIARDLDLFTGTPAPPDVRERFVQWNEMRGWAPSLANVPPAHASAARDQLANRFPAVDPSGAHGVLAVELSRDVTFQLWAAPIDGGGECAMTQHVDAQGVARGAVWTFALCVGPATPRAPRAFGVHGPGGGDGPYVTPGIAPGAATVELRYADGHSARAPVVEGFFLVPVEHMAFRHEPGVRPQAVPAGTLTEVVSYDGRGEELARTETRTPGVSVTEAVAGYLAITAEELRRRQEAGESPAAIAAAEGKTALGLEQAIVADAMARVEAGPVYSTLTPAEQADVLAGWKRFAHAFAHGRAPDAHSVGERPRAYVVAP